MKAVIPDDSPPVLGTSPALDRLRSQLEVEYYDTLPGSLEKLIERIRQAEIVINVRSSCRFTADVFDHCPNLRLLSIWGTGTDNVDLAAAQTHGIAVTNTPGVSAASVAEHALALLLAVARNLPVQDAEVRAGNWPRGGGLELYGKTLGVIGLGAIGRRFAQLAQGVGMRVIAWTFHPEDAFEMVSLDQLLQSSDVVSLHVRLTPATRNMIGPRELALMKSGAILINTARGALISEAALIDALTSKRIRGAGLDVFAGEPLPPGHPFTRLPNMVLTPHSAGITPEALEAGLQLAVSNVLNWIAGSPANVVIGN